MKPLDTHQINHIEQFLLEQYNLYFIDIRAEVLDHIASEIEQQMTLGKTYEEAFVLTMAKWDVSLRTSKYYYKGIPRFIAKQWLKDRFGNLALSVLFGMLTLVGIVTLLNLFSLEEESIDTLYVILLLIGSGCVLMMHIINYRKVNKIPCKTARGQYLRLEVKRNVLLNLIIVGNGISVMNMLVSFDYIQQLYVLYMLIVLFDKVRWYWQYKQARVLEIKWL